jgi:pimeloyl-ACP methyl ester carboxylesterase
MNQGEVHVTRPSEGCSSGALTTFQLPPTGCLPRTKPSRGREAAFVVDDRDDRILELATPDGPLTVRYFSAIAGKSTSAVILIGGVGGGFDSPAGGLYPKLAAEMPGLGVAVLRVRYRKPHDLEASTADVLRAAAFLKEHGHQTLAIVGHSFGGAVAIRAALRNESIGAVVTLATQAAGTEGVGQLRRPLLLLHGTSDTILGHQCSERVQARAGEDAELELYPDAGHVLDEVSSDVQDRVRGWLLEKLQRPQSGVR